MSVHKINSLTLDLEASSLWSITHLTGAWGREGQRTTQVGEEIDGLQCNDDCRCWMTELDPFQFQRLPTAESFED